MKKAANKIPNYKEIESNLSISWGLAFVKKDTTAIHIYSLELQQMRKAREHLFKRQREGSL